MHQARTQVWRFLHGQNTVTLQLPLSSFLRGLLLTYLTSNISLYPRVVATVAPLRVCCFLRRLTYLAEVIHCHILTLFQYF